MATTRREVLLSMMAAAAVFATVPAEAAGLFSRARRKPLQWLTVGGQSIFPVYGMSGRISSNLMAVLFDKIISDGGDIGRHGLHEERGGRWYVMEFGYEETAVEVQKKINEAVRVLSA